MEQARDALKGPTGTTCTEPGPRWSSRAYLGDITLVAVDASQSTPIMVRIEGHSQTMARRIHCFRGGPARRTRERRRAKYSDEARLKVLQVRRQKACLRCKLLKIQCSRESPCSPCLSSAVRAVERKVLSFCYCIRTRFSEVNIFENDSTELDNLASRINSLVSRIGGRNRPSPHNSARFEDLLGCWLTRPEFSLPTGSIVGLLCSGALSSQLGAAIDDDFVADFRTFLFTTSLASSGWRDRDVTLRDLYKAGHIAGFNLLNRLDRVLTPQFLAKCGREKSKTMLLLVLGIVIGVGYSTHATGSPVFPHDTLNASFQERPSLWLTMREHLCQMLAHHLIFIGSAFGVKFSTGLEQQIIDTAVKRWNKLEVNMWADMLSHLGGPEDAKLGAGDDKLLEDDSKALVASPIVAAACDDATELNQLARFSEQGEMAPVSFSENPASYLSMGDDFFSDNPTSFLEMADDDVPPEAPPQWSPPSDWSTDVPPPYTETPTLLPEEQYPAVGQPLRKIKRRSVWVVRPFESEKDGTVNVQARFRVESGQGIGLFP